MVSKEEFKLVEIPTDEVIFREDLYPRFETDQALIEKYANSIEYLPPIFISPNNILIDGYHRWKAHQLAKKEKIKAYVIPTKSEAEIEVLAYKYNSTHGKQLSNAEKKAFAQKKIGLLSVKEIAEILSVDERTIRRWTETQRKALEEERKRKVLELYLKAWNTQEKIAEELGIPRRTVSDILERFGENGQMSEFAKDFNLYLYNIWKLGKKDQETEHFGVFPLVYMLNLLYYHTELFDVVFDPFAGSGTTVDACKKLLRRYYCSDRIVKPGREKDIKEWDITNGLPPDLPKPDLAFLDPPYWKQAQGKYSNDPTDLGNMTLEDFYATMQNLLRELKRRKVPRIAIVIQPTQYANDNHKYEDHIFVFHDFLKDKYEIEMRYILPYSTQQYNAQQVEIMKNERKCMVLHRDLVVWKWKHDKT